MNHIITSISDANVKFGLCEVSIRWDLLWLHIRPGILEYKDIQVIYSMEYIYIYI